jgi:hypothetical protein
VKKSKQPGENISLKTKKNESPAVMEWINSQSNLMDSIRYLIENEIRQNGVRNLQLTIPSDRSHLLAAMFPPAEAAMAEVAAAAEPAVTEALPQEAVAVEEPEAVEEEFDEEDIESWI